VVVSVPARLAFATIEEVLLRCALKALAINSAGFAVGDVTALKALLQSVVEVVIIQAADATIP
jgi:citrate lyase gamma subunit